MKMTTLFAENFSLGMGIPIGNNGTFSLVPTTLAGVGSSVVGAGTQTVKNSEFFDDFVPLGSATAACVGSSSIELGSGTVTNSFDAYAKTLEELNTTQAYMESLNQNELEDLIAKLEAKDISLSFEDENIEKILKI